MAFDHRELRAFIAVCESGSLGRAASIANMSQPALSRVIQQMERRFGHPLFDRHSKGMSPTTSGQALLPFARLLLFEMEQASEALNFLTGHSRGTVRVGAVSSVARDMLPGAMNKLLSQLPNIRVELLESTDRRLLDALVNREVDLVIAPDLPPHDDIMSVGRCEYEDEYVVFCSATHPLADANPGLDQLLTQSWLMTPPGTTPRYLFENLIHRAGRVTPKIDIETSAPGALIAFVLHSEMLGWLPRPLIRAELEAQRAKLLTVPELVQRRKFFAYMRRRGSVPSPVRQLLRIITES